MGNSICLQWLLASLPSLWKLSCITLPVQLSLPTKAMVLYLWPISCFHCYSALTNASDHPRIILTHLVYGSYSLRGCQNRLFMPTLHNFATAVHKSYAPLKTERRLFLQYEQSCQLVMTECTELHTYHKAMPCAPYRNRSVLFLPTKWVQAPLLKDEQLCLLCALQANIRSKWHMLSYFLLSSNVKNEVGHGCPCIIYTHLRYSVLLLNQNSTLFKTTLCFY